MLHYNVIEVANPVDGEAPILPNDVNIEMVEARRGHVAERDADIGRESYLSGQIFALEEVISVDEADVEVSKSLQVALIPAASARSVVITEETDRKTEISGLVKLPKSPIQGSIHAATGLRSRQNAKIVLILLKIGIAHRIIDVDDENEARAGGNRLDPGLAEVPHDPRAAPRRADDRQIG